MMEFESKRSMKRAKSLGWIQQCRDFVKGVRPLSPRSDRRPGQVPETSRLWASADQLHRHR